MSQETQPRDKRSCHLLRETLLLGLCLLRSGVLETQLHDATVARVEQQTQVCSTGTDGSAPATPAPHHRSPQAISP
jgi:hypothetical protein